MTFETPDEEILFNLGKSSFLSIWSYSKLYRNQGDVTRKGDGKELCDFSVVFGKTILLFSDKRVEFKHHSEEVVAWNRWHRKAVSKSADQLNGAERWIVHYPERIFKDRKCEENLGLNSSGEYTIHKIIVTHGLEDVLEARFGEASFSYTNKAESTYTVNQNDPNSAHFLHIFTGDSLLFVISQIDTAKDFTKYLELRKSAFSRRSELYVQKESDLVHMYFKRDKCVDINSLEKISKTSNPICICYNGIDGLLGDSAYIAKRLSDEISYSWDLLIEHFSEHAVQGTLTGPIGVNLSETEFTLRRLAETSRLERRVLSSALWDKWAETTIGQRGMRLLLQSHSDILYVLLFLPDDTFNSNEEYRIFRRGMAADYIYVFGEENRNYLEVICLGIRTNWTEQTDISNDVIASVINEGVDICFMDNSEWTSEGIDNARQLRSQLEEEGLLTPDQRTFSNRRDLEFE